jgi:hypothetical protein
VNDDWILYAWAGSNIVAVLMLFVSWRWAEMGRLLYSLLFLWAGQFNLRTAMTDPGVYLDYADFAALALYHDFILGFFARHTTEIVGVIALGQLAIAGLIATRGRAVHLGLAGAVVFLLAILPLGIGAGFPATVTMAAGACLLVRRRYSLALPQLLRRTRRGESGR